MFSSKIAYRNIPRRKARSILTVTAILLGVALFVGINMATASAMGEFTSYINKFWGATDIVVKSGNGQVFNDATANIVSANPKVSNTALRLSWSVIVANTSNSYPIIGVDTSHDFDYASFNITGNRLLSSGQAVVDNQIAQKYLLTIGSVLRVTTKTYVAPHNITLSLTVIGINYPLRNLGATIYTDLTNLQGVLGLDARISIVYASLFDPGQAIQAEQALQYSLGATFDVTAPKAEAVHRIQGQTSGFQLGLNVMIAVSLVVCSFIVFNTLYMTVSERIYEIGVMRAIGSSKSQIFNIFLTEGFLIGIIGATVGVFAGLGIARLFTNIFENNLGFPNLPQAELTPIIALTGIIVGFLAVITGSLYPSFFASRTNIMQAIRPMARNQRIVHNVTILTIGLVMLGLGIVEALDFAAFHVPYVDVVLVPLGVVIIGGIIFGQLGRILLIPISTFSHAVAYVASRTGRRRLLRNTVCFGMIAVTLSFTILIGGIQSGVQQALQAGVQEALGADIILVANQSIPVTFTNNLTKFSNVSYATPLAPANIPAKAFGSNGNSSSIGVVAVDPTVFSRIISYSFVGSTSSTDAYSQLARNNESLLIPQGLAVKLGVTDGDKLHLFTQISNTTIPFTIAGVFTGPVLQYINYYGEHYASDTIIVSLNSQAKYFAGDYKSPLFLVDLQNHDHNLATTTARNIASTYPRYDFSENSLTLAQLLSLVNNTINRIFALILLILYFALLIATLGISATMIMNVNERRREIGLLRSQGMSRIQITSLFLGEGVLIGFFGFLLAIPAGLILLLGATNSASIAGFWIPFVIPYGTILEALPLALTAVLTGSIYPAVRAARMQITKALGQV